MPLEIKDYRFRHRPDGPWVLDGINLRLERGECAAISGKNGSGKSTLVSAVCGLLPGFGPGQAEGILRTENPPPAAVLQNLDAQILSDSVTDEISFFLRHSRPHDAKPTPEQIINAAGLSRVRERKVHLLSTGEKQRLVCGCALACAAAGLVIFDEPSAYLDDDGAAELSGMIKDIKRRGLAVLIAGHEFSRLGNVIEKSFRLENGRLVSTPLEDAHTGLTAKEKPGPLSQGFQAADITCLSDEGEILVNNFSFEIPRGLIVGLSGPNGSGKSTLARLAAGFPVPHSGQITIAELKAERKDLAAKVRLLGQNPYTQLLYRTAGENFDRAKREAKTPCGYSLSALAQSLGIAQLRERTVQSLSYGQAQRCALFCAAAANPEFIILDEAVSCLDAEGIAAFHGALKTFCSHGGGALVISHMARLTQEFADTVYSIPGGDH